ncbi:AI-2E family transporter [Acetobacter ascendens]|uniref:AI-2E family transporter n=1 Tax=Acetobacter ascendens TaxID=481146 RepID=UPI001D176530|nr:AI-2E family transporter [Acetobacter ascendens]
MLVALLACTLVLGAVWILEPFIPALIWAGTIAVTMWPLLLRLQAWLHGSRKMAISCTLLVALALFVLPFWMAVSTVVKHADAFSRIVPYIKSLKLPDLPDKLLHLPLVGEYLGKWWQHLQNMKPMDIVQQAVPQPDQIMHYLMSYAGSIGMLAVQFLLTLIILAAFLAKAEYLISTRISSVMGWTAPNGIAMCQGEVVAEFTEEATHGTNYPYWHGHVKKCFPIARCKREGAACFAQEAIPPGDGKVF